MNLNDQTPTRVAVVAALLIVCLFGGGCESDSKSGFTPYDPHGMPNTSFGLGHRVGQREGQGPAVGQNPAYRDDLSDFYFDNSVETTGPPPR